MKKETEKRIFLFVRRMMKIGGVAGIEYHLRGENGEWYAVDGDPGIEKAARQATDDFLRSERMNAEEEIQAAEDLADCAVRAWITEIGEEGRRGIGGEDFDRLIKRVKLLATHPYRR